MKSKEIQSATAAPPQPSNSTVLLYADVAARAYNIYERSGYVDGNDEANWLEAETVLAGESPL